MKRERLELLLSQNFPGRTPNLGINDAIFLEMKKRGAKLRKRCTRMDFGVKATGRCVIYQTQQNPDSTSRVPSTEATVCATYSIKSEAFMI